MLFIASCVSHRFLIDVHKGHIYLRDLGSLSEKLVQLVITSLCLKLLQLNMDIIATNTPSRLLPLFGDL